MVRGESSWPSPPAPPLQHREDSLRSRRKDGVLPNFKPWQEKSRPPWGLQRVMRSPPSHPLKQEENSIQAILGKRRQPLSRRETDEGPISLADKPSNFSERKRALFTSLSTRRRFPSLLVRGESSWPSPPAPPLPHREESLRSRGKDGVLPSFQPWQEKSRPPCGLQRVMRSPLSHPLKQEENSIQAILGKRRQLLSRRELPYKFSTSSSTRRELPPTEWDRRGSHLTRRQARPTSRGRRGLRLPLSRQEETSFLSWQGKLRDLLTIFPSSSEDGRELTGLPELPYLPKRKAFYFILDKKRLRSSSKLVRQKRAPSKERQAPPRSWERKELRLPLSRHEESSCSPGKGRTSWLSNLPLQHMKGVYAQEETGGSRPFPQS